MNSGTDINQRMFEQEKRFVAAKSGIPTQKSNTSSSHQVAQIVFAKVDIVVGGNERHLGRLTLRFVVQTLAGVKACSVTLSSC